MSRVESHGLPVLRSLATRKGLHDSFMQHQEQECLDATAFYIV